MTAAVDPNPGFLRAPFGRLVKCGNGVNQRGSLDQAINDDPEGRIMALPSWFLCVIDHERKYHHDQGSGE